MVTKVYEGLSSVSRGTVYHLGHYKVDFPDGELTFQLHARICEKADCPCDNIRIDWSAGDSSVATWYTAEGAWTDMDHQPVHPEVQGVYAIVAATDTFVTRCRHLVYLRRRQVLEEQGRLSHFQVSLPGDLLGPGGDPTEGILGTVVVADQSMAYGLQFCADHDCFCRDLFLFLPPGGDAVHVINPEGQWTTLERKSARPSAKQLKKLRAHLAKEPIFEAQLSHFRAERTLHNYHRFVSEYKNRT